MLETLLEFVLHFDRHLDAFVLQYGVLTYLILFTIVFAETGFVVTPFLPGDSLLFAAGAVAARGTLDVWVVVVLLAAAAIAGDTLNYWIGAAAGPRVFHQRSRLFRRDFLERAHAFYEKYGAITIVLARFMPILRTFAPFVAGVGRMTYSRFLIFNVVGGLAWVVVFVLGGYLFGNFGFVRRNFSAVVAAIIVISFLPMAIDLLRRGAVRRRTER